MTARLALGSVVAVLAFGLAACGGSSGDGSAPDPTPPTSTADPASASASEPAVETGPLEVLPEGGTGVGICARFSSADISDLAGSEVSEGQVAGPLDSACAWDFTTDGIVLVQAMTPDFWSAFPQTGDPDYAEVPGIGNEAFVQPSLVSGWTAAALFDDRLILADVSGPTATPELAVHLLEGVAPRLGP